MYVATIEQYSSPETSSIKQEDLQTLQREAKTPGRPFTIGHIVQDKTMIQIAHEQESNVSKLSATVLDQLHLPPNSAPSRIVFSTTNSLFTPNAPLTAPVVEYVEVAFPAALTTSSFRDQVSADFIRFDTQCKTLMHGDIGLATGWGTEDVEHEGVEGGKSRCFYVARGWESMRAFEELVATEVYRDAVQILLGWKAPFKMWHVERMVGTGA